MSDETAVKEEEGDRQCRQHPDFDRIIQVIILQFRLLPIAVPAVTVLMDGSSLDPDVI